MDNKSDLKNKNITNPHPESCACSQEVPYPGALRSKAPLPSPAPKLNTSPQLTPPKKSYGLGNLSQSYTSLYPHKVSALIFLSRQDVRDEVDPIEEPLLPENVQDFKTGGAVALLNLF